MATSFIQVKTIGDSLILINLDKVYTISIQEGKFIKVGETLKRNIFEITIVFEEKADILCFTIWPESLKNIVKDRG